MRAVVGSVCNLLSGTRMHAIVGRVHALHGVHCIGQHHFLDNSTRGRESSTCSLLGVHRRMGQPRLNGRICWGLNWLTLCSQLPRDPPRGTQTVRVVAATGVSHQQPAGRHSSGLISKCVEVTALSLSIGCPDKTNRCFDLLSVCCVNLLCSSAHVLVSKLVGEAAVPAIAGIASFQTCITPIKHPNALASPCDEHCCRSCPYCQSTHLQIRDLMSDRIVPRMPLVRLPVETCTQSNQCTPVHTM